MIELIQSYWHYWLIVTTATWVSFFVGFYIKNKYGKGESSELGRTFEFIFRYGLDMPCNWFLTFFPFFDLPDSPTELVTYRLIRYKIVIYIPKRKRTPLQQYRYVLALLMCGILNKGDKDHC